MENVLVSGGCGFIGSAVVEQLLKNNKNVIILRKSDKPLSRIRENKIDGARRISIDLANSEELLSSGIQIDTCYHFAWDGISGEALSDIDRQYRNIRYCYNLQKTVARMGCKRFIGAGSIGQLELKHEKCLAGRERYYKCAKDACEDFCRTNADELGIDFIWPLITNSYGVGEESNRFVNYMIKELLRENDLPVSEGKQFYDFVYIDDVAKAFYLIGEYGHTGKRYIVGSGEAKRHREWIEPVPGYLQSEGRLQFGKYASADIFLEKKDFDILELVQDTGYQPKVSFEEGIKKTAEYMIENGIS